MVWTASPHVIFPITGIHTERHQRWTMVSDVSQILTKIGITLWVAGFICVLASAAHRQPGVTFRELFWRGSFQRREDYTPEGWRLLWAGTILAIVGFALFAAASFYA